MLEMEWEFGGIADATGGTASVPSAPFIADATGGTASVPSAPFIADATERVPPHGIAEATGGTASVPSAPFITDATERVPPRGITDATGGTASVPSAPFITDATERVPPRGMTDATERVPPHGIAEATGGTASVPSAPFITDATERVPPRGIADATERVLPVRKCPSKNSVLVPRDNRAIILLVTVNANRRQAVFADDKAVACILEAWNKAQNWLVGRYVIMPDHLHFFCAAGLWPVPDFHAWMAYWKSLVARTFPCAHDLPLWQRECWDVQMRTVEGYREKWNYIRNNPVRKGLVANADDWPYQGFQNILEWHD